jgi:hypothetical protein
MRGMLYVVTKRLLHPNEILILLFQDDKKKDIGIKANQARTSVTEITSAIERMRQSRDIKLSDIERLQLEIQVG